MRLFTEMTELVTVGQYLDMRIAAAPLSALDGQLDDIRATMRSKTASYTAEFPLALGASAARGDGTTFAARARGGVSRGHRLPAARRPAWHRGRARVTGKPVGGDIREGKRTVPLWHAWTHTDDAAVPCREWRRLATRRRRARSQSAIAVIEDSGAIAAVESEIADSAARAAELVAGLDVPPEGRESLAELLSAWGVRAA